MIKNILAAAAVTICCIGAAEVPGAKPAKASTYAFMQACMNEGASYAWCQCAANHVISGASVYQAAHLCNQGIGAMNAGGGGAGYVGNRVECMIVRDQPMLLAAMNCY